MTPRGGENGQKVIRTKQTNAREAYRQALPPLARRPQRERERKTRGQ